MGTTRQRARWLVLLTVVAIALVGVVSQVVRAGERVARETPRAHVPDPSRPPDDVAAVIQAEVGLPAATLEAWVLEPDSPVATTLVLQGTDDSKASMMGVGRELRARGHRAILVERGVREPGDLSQLLDQLEALGLIAGPLAIYEPS